jgi:hypothetical protein
MLLNKLKGWFIMKTLLYICFLPLLFLSSCKEGPQGPAGSTGPAGEDPTDPNIVPRVVWVWLDSPRPICRYCFKLHNDSLPIGYTPGRLLIRFNKIMVSYTVIPNVTLLPKEDGFAYLSSWGANSIDGQTFEWPVYGYFKIGQSYTITVGKEATDVTNRKLVTDYQRVLIPEPVLRIVDTYPQPNDTTVQQFSSYSVYFNSPIDSNSLINNVTISPTVTGKWKIAYYDIRNINFSPDFGFTGNTWYEITFSTGIKDTFNNHLPIPHTLRFKSAPFKVMSTYPSNGQQNVGLLPSISCYFTTHIDTTTARNAFWIAPSVSGVIEFSPYTLDYFAFKPSQNYLPNTTYTVTILTSMRSTPGDTLATPFVFSFKTASTGN